MVELIDKWKKETKGLSKEKDKEKLPPKEKEKDAKNEKDKKAKENSTSKIFEKISDKSLGPKRNGMRKALANSFLTNMPKGFTEDIISEKIINIENEMSKNFSDDGYIQRGKSLVSNIQDPKNEEFKIKILDGTFPPSKLISMDVSEMLNQDMKKEMAKVEQEGLDARRSDWNEKHIKVSEGVYKCFKCGERRCTTNQIQMRSADEPMTIFVTCANCGNTWKI